MAYVVDHSLGRLFAAAFAAHFPGHSLGVLPVNRVLDQLDQGGTQRLLNPLGACGAKDSIS